MTQLALVPEVLPVIEFSVAGSPVPQGSKQALISGRREKRGKDTWVRNPIASIVDSANRRKNDKGALDRWRGWIAARATIVMRGRDIIDQAVELNCEFVLPRPPSHYTDVSKRLRQGKTGAPEFPTLPDLSKLVRAVEDSMTGIVYRDDGLIVQYGVMKKRYAATLEAVGGVRVKVRAL